MSKMVVTEDTHRHTGSLKDNHVTLFSEMCKAVHHPCSLSIFPCIGVSACNIIQHITLHCALVWGRSNAHLGHGRFNNVYLILSWHSGMCDSVCVSVCGHVPRLDCRAMTSSKKRTLPFLRWEMTNKERCWITNNPFETELLHEGNEKRS